MPRQKTALVLGAGGFIGAHLVKRLKAEGLFVVGVDTKPPPFSPSQADKFVICDLRDYIETIDVLCITAYDEIYQLAADMGGAGYIFTGEHDAAVMHNSATINLNVLQACVVTRFKGRIFYSSSACIYPERNQMDPDNPICVEDSAYPADPDSEYGWEKLFSERLYAAYRRNYGIQTYVGRFHNIYGPEGTWKGGKEKAPAAICRKVAEATDSIEVWGDGEQTRSFLFIDDCIDAVLAMVRSDFYGPVNIGSEEMVSINELADMVINMSSKNIAVTHVEGPLGVRGRCSDNRLIAKKLDWRPKWSLREGIAKTFPWVAAQVRREEP